MISKQLLKTIRSLHHKKYRDLHGLFLAEGSKMVFEALQDVPGSVQYLLHTAKGLPEVLQPLISANNISLDELKSADFESLSLQKSPQGIMAVIKQAEVTLPERDQLTDLSLVLDAVRDPGNLGTIIRLADWFGIEKIICSEDTVDCYNPKVVQATMGAIFRVKLVYTSLLPYLQSVKAHGEVTLYGTSLGGKDLYTIQSCFPSMIILGNESVGMRSELEAICHENLMIPSFNKANTGSESLNVSMAAGIICSEFRRQQQAYSK